MMAAAWMVNLFYLLPNWLSMSSALLSASSDSGSATTFLTTYLMQLIQEIVQYGFSFV